MVKLVIGPKILLANFCVDIPRNLERNRYVLAAVYRFIISVVVSKMRNCFVLGH